MHITDSPMLVSGLILLSTFCLAISMNSRCPPFAQIRPCFCDEHGDFLALECNYRTAGPISQSFKSIYGAKVNVVDVKISGVIQLNQEFFGNLTPEAIVIEAPRLTTLNKEVFKGQENSLRSLVISKSDFVEFPLEAIVPLAKLDSLEVSHSTIGNWSQLDNLECASDLRKLYLNNNNFSTVHNDTFGNLTSLQYLNLGFNKIESIEPGSFAQNAALTHLFLQNNKLKAIPSSITVLGRSAFVNMESNQIIHVTDECLVRLIVKDMYVAFEDNPIICDCELEILTTFKDHMYGTCQGPEKLKGKKFSQLLPEYFKPC